MEKYNIPVGHLPGHKQEPQKEYVVMDKKKNVKPKDIFVGYKETKSSKKKIKK